MNHRKSQIFLRQKIPSAVLFLKTRNKDKKHRKKKRQYPSLLKEEDRITLSERTFAHNYWEKMSVQIIPVMSFRPTLWVFLTFDPQTTLSKTQIKKFRKWVWAY